MLTYRMFSSVQPALQVEFSSPSTGCEGSSPSEDICVSPPKGKENVDGSVLSMDAEGTKEYIKEDTKAWRTGMPMLWSFIS